MAANPQTSAESSKRRRRHFSVEDSQDYYEDCYMDESSNESLTTGFAGGNANINPGLAGFKSFLNGERKNNEANFSQFYTF